MSAGQITSTEGGVREALCFGEPKPGGVGREVERHPPILETLSTDLAADPGSSAGPGGDVVVSISFLPRLACFYVRSEWDSRLEGGRFQCFGSTFHGQI